MRRWRLARTVFALALTCSLLQSTRPVKACGPFFEQAVFAFPDHPDLPLAPFAAGDLGVLQPTYARSYLAVAYRYLSGLALDAEARRGADELWRERRSPWYDTHPPAQIDLWTGKRRRLSPPPGLAGLLDRVTNYRPVPGGTFELYLNCPADAFRSASKTVDELSADWGPSSTAVTEWLTAQDIVFANCGDGEHVPPPLPAGATREAAALRQYQIAAAYFYAGRFDEAEARFRAIARDESSPRRTIAAYLVARTIVRRATLAVADGFDERELGRARAELDSILTNPALSAVQGPARALEGFVLYRLDPDQGLRGASRELLKPDPGSRFKQALSDYTFGLDTLKARTGHDIAEGDARDDLTDWITTFQRDEPAALDRAVERWRALRAVPWLVAAVSKISGTDARTPALLSAVDGIGWRSPGSATLAYHAARLRIERGDTAVARAALDGLIGQPPASQTRSARNQFLSLRMRLANSLVEFLRYAQRRPAGATSPDGLEDQPVDARGSRLAQMPGVVAFDRDGVAALNERLPLAWLAEAAIDPVLPENLRRGVALAAWTRAVMLGQSERAAALAPILSRLVPAMKRDLDEYARLDAAHGQALAGVTIVLRNPGARPLATAGMERETKLGVIDSYRDNWWCAPGPPQSTPLAFLSAVDRVAADNERAALSALGSGRARLAAEAIRLAKLFPDDPKAPEVLHLAVRATRYGCGDDRTGVVSRAAFELLHRKYPNTQWAKLTPYWFDG